MKTKQEILIDVLNERIKTSKIGLLIKNIDNINPVEVSSFLSEQLKEELFVSIIGYGPISKTTKNVSIRIEDAVKWRSEPDKSGKIIVFIWGETDKLHSLAEFEEISTRDLTKRLISTCKEKDRNAPENKFWDALSDSSSHYPYSIIEEYIQNVEDENEPSAIGNNLWRLGLLCDKNILSKDSKPEDRLKQNSDLIIIMGQLSEESRKKISRSLSRGIKDNNKELQIAYKGLQKYFKYGEKNTLKELDLSIVQLLFSYTSKTDKSEKPDSPNHKKDPNAPIKAKDVSKRISEMVVGQEKDAISQLKDLYDGLCEHFDCETDFSSELTTNIDAFDSRPIQIEKVNNQFRQIIGTTCGIKSWGGVLYTKEVVLRDALYSEYDSFRPFNPTICEDGFFSFGGKSLFEYIRHFNSILLKEGSDHIEDFDPILSQLESSRELLIKKLDMIMNYPVLSFAVDDSLFANLTKYIDSWKSLLHAFCNNEREMHDKSSGATVWIAKSLMMLDILYVRTPGEWKAILLPTHPLHLWKYYEIFKSLKQDRDNIHKRDAEELTRVLNALPQILNFVVVDKMITESDSSAELPCSGLVEMLPSYENKTNRYLGGDGIECISEYISRWIDFAPYSKNEVRICTVDAPDLPRILKDLKDCIENNVCESIYYAIYLTRNQNGNNELSKLDYSSEDYEIGELIKEGRLNINILNVDSKEQVKQILGENPVHLAFYFDQLTYSIDHGPTTKSLYISPLVISYDYSFDEVNGVGVIFPSSDMDSGMIGDYHKMLKYADLVSIDRVPRPTYNQDSDISSILTTIKDENTQWLIAADRTTNQYLPDDSIPIGEKQYGKRSVTIWTSSHSRIISQYLSILRNYNLYPKSENLVRILSKFGHISSEGLVTIPKVDFNKDTVEIRRKGLLGTIFAATWYSNQYHDSIVASLDSSDARLWLSNNEYSNERADLIGLRYEETTNTIIFQPIEVKTRDESPDAIITTDEKTGEKVIEGHAANQVASVVKILEEIFGLIETDTIDMFVSARREVLKYQIVSECFRNNYNSEWQKQWSKRLKDAFANNRKINVVISGMLIHIKLGQPESRRLDKCINKEFDDTIIDFVELGTNDIQEYVLGDCAIPKSTIINAIDFDNTESGQEIPDEQITLDAPIILNNTTNVIDEIESQEKEIESITPTGRKLDSERSIEENVAEIQDLISDFKKSCNDYSIRLKDVCKPEDAIIGPSIIRVYFTLQRGQQLNPLLSKMEDISREMKRTGILVQQIPNSDKLVLDIPRKKREIVLFRNVIEQMPHVDSPEKLYFTLGRTPDGVDLYKNLSELPHLLVAGSTGSGKTIFLCTLLASLLSTHRTKEELQILLSSSGMEDFIHFEGIPHLVGGKIVSDATEATELIQNTVFEEFERREKILTDARVSNISQYNATHSDKLAPIVVIIDEFADLTDELSTKSEKEAFFTPIKRIAQIGRKRGIHLILCTQRPSATLVPTNIKSQLTGRVALRVNDSNSSRMILEDSGDARFLLNHGDMIYRNAGESERAQGYFISNDELDALINDIKNNHR